MGSSGTIHPADRSLATTKPLSLRTGRGVGVRVFGGWSEAIQWVAVRVEGSFPLCKFASLFQNAPPHLGIRPLVEIRE